MESVAIPVLWLVGVVCLLAGIAGGWFAARQYGRDLQRGMSKQEAIDAELGKVTAAAGDVQSQVKAAVLPYMQALMNEIQKLKNPPSQ